MLGRGESPATFCSAGREHAHPHVQQPSGRPRPRPSCPRQRRRGELHGGNRRSEGDVGRLARCDLAGFFRGPPAPHQSRSRMSANRHHGHSPASGHRSRRHPTRHCRRYPGRVPKIEVSGCVRGQWWFGATMTSAARTPREMPRNIREMMKSAAEIQTC